MKQEGLKERVELLEAGEKLGYPRLGYGRSTKIPHDKRIPAGKEGWEKFAAHAHVRRIYPALRIARVLRDNNVIPYNPPSGRAQGVATSEERSSPQSVVSTEDTARGAVPSTVESPSPAADLLDDVLPLAPKEPMLSVSPAPRPKKGGHKKPPHPGSKRAQRG